MRCLYYSKYHIYCDVIRILWFDLCGVMCIVMYLMCVVFRAIYRRAVCLLEAGKASEAVEGFKDLYRVDRNWPNLSEWLVKAFSLQKRQVKNSTYIHNYAQ